MTVGRPSLSNDCLAAILALVPLQERLSTCALVCKRWHGLVTTEPQLLQTLELKISNDSGWHRRRKGASKPAAESEQRLPSLLCFLSAAAPHVRQLDLHLEAPPLYDMPALRQLGAVLQACLGRCGSLESLTLSLCDVPCVLGPWLAPLAGSLRRLQVEYTVAKLHGNARGLWVQPEGLGACTQLEELSLDGGGWLEAPAACWPPSLTSLELRLPCAFQLPPSMTALGSLRRLRLTEFYGKPDTWQALSQLTALQQLELERCRYLPGPRHLAALERLQSLELLSTPARRVTNEVRWNDSEDEEGEEEQAEVSPAAEVEEALAALGGRQVTHLKIAGCDFLAVPPQGLSHFSSLRSLSLDSEPDDDAELSWQRVELPLGGWHHNLTRLELPHAILGAPAVLRALQATTGLEELTVWRFSLPPCQPMADALRWVAWAASLPRLRRLTVGLCEGWSQSPLGMTARCSRSRRRGNCFEMNIVPAESLLQRQAIAAMGALATAALQVQARRPGLAIRMLSQAELCPDGQEGEWVPYSF